MKSTKWKIHVSRGLMGYFPFLLSVFAIKHLPLAQFMSLANLSPIIMTIFAAFWFGENVGNRELITLMLGFIGMLMCIKLEFTYLSLLSIGSNV